jgi:hypothetical protein
LTACYEYVTIKETVGEVRPSSYVKRGGETS